MTLADFIGGFVLYWGNKVMKVCCCFIGPVLITCCIGLVSAVFYVYFNEVLPLSTPVYG